ncbi:tyrosine-type recombinase/integrase [Desulfomonile tiedjei]|uniref:tyrosine-type recombinase/integrase n=1 Tax=Desulfomonile tiedjei TaxID=2358 RepID=UPI0002F1D2BF|nr:tyrosine-type recombinase/integrase [Desulfomonile tiedjei]
MESTALTLTHTIQHTVTHDHIVDVFLSGRTETTRRAYAADMVHFAGLLGVVDNNEAVHMFISCGPARGNAIALDYRNNTWRGNRRAPQLTRRLSTLRSLLKVARMIGLVNWELAVENVKHRSYRDTRGPRESGFRKLQMRAEQRTDAKGIRDHAILLLLHDLGLRRNEVCSLDLQDVNLEHSTISVLGKGNAQKTSLSLPKRTAEALRTWIKRKRERRRRKMCLSLFSIDVYS